MAKKAEKPEEKPASAKAPKDYVLTPVAGFDPGKLKIKRQVTLPLLKWEDSVPRYIRFDGEIHEGKAIVTKGETKGQMEPANIARVTNLETSMQCEIIVGAVLKGNLEEHYPKHSYVGKCFKLIQTKIPNKRYKAYSIEEIELT